MYWLSALVLGVGLAAGGKLSRLVRTIDGAASRTGCVGGWLPSLPWRIVPGRYDLTSGHAAEVGETRTFHCVRAAVDASQRSEQP